MRQRLLLVGRTSRLACRLALLVLSALSALGGPQVVQAAPPPAAQCQQAEQALPGYLAAWRSLLARRLNRSEDSLADRISLTRGDVICWNEGISIAVQYSVRYGWAEVAAQDRLPVMHSARPDGTALPQPVLLTPAQLQATALAPAPGLTPAELMPIELDARLGFASQAEAETRMREAFFQRSGVAPQAVLGTRLNFFVPGRVPRVNGQPWLLMTVALDDAANRCGDGRLNLVTGEWQALETRCRVSAGRGIAP